ncbi:MAG TPA: sigma 54-interacting transcriptional regulator [Polyangia bacterium]
MIAGPAAGRRQVMTGDELRIGKAPSNHLSIPDNTVSRFHCVIEKTPRGLLLRDLNSFNGTQVAGCWVESAYLAPNATVQIGQTVMQVFREVEKGRSHETAPRILGRSAATQRLVAMLPQLARTGATILLEGETGTGKSMVAEFVHRMGHRANGPFVVVDGGAMSPSLIESELFGHERGAFTGATERRIGAFEAAQGGTIFLDEIGELPLELQPKLLRALEERVIRRLGSTQSVRLDVQVIAATNRKLEEAVAQGRFRADLYYRLETLRLTIPPLRDRREDIPQLVEHFARRTCVDVSEETLASLQERFSLQRWPGNVRELRNAVERAVLLGVLQQEDLGVPQQGDYGEVDVTHPAGRDHSLAPIPAWGGTPADANLVPFRAAKENAVSRWEKDYLTQLMQRAGGNLSLAARMAQIDRGHLRDLLRHHEVGGRETASLPIQPAGKTEKQRSTTTRSLRTPKLPPPFPNALRSS